MAARSIPAIAGLRSVAGAAPSWHLAAYVAVLAAVLIGFGRSNFEPPFQQEVLGSVSVEISPSTWKLQGGNLLPGASATTAFVVRNPSAGPIRVSLIVSSSTPTGRNLGDALYLLLKTVGRGCDRFDGRVLARGGVGTFSLGDATLGQQPGDRVVAPGKSLTFCLRAMLPVNVGNEFQGTNTVLRLTVSAEGVRGR